MIRRLLIPPIAAAAALVLMLVAWPAHAKTSCLPDQLKAALAHVERNFGKVSVISAYRRGAIIAGTRRQSKHASCRAVDFHVSGNRKAAIRWLGKQPLELITYGCHMSHIHIATGSYRGHHCVDRRGRRIRK